MNDRLISEKKFFEKLPRRAKMDISKIPKQKLETVMLFLMDVCKKTANFYVDAIRSNYLYFNYDPKSTLLPRISYGNDHDNYLNTFAVELDNNWFFKTPKSELSDKYLKQLSKLKIYTFEELYVIFTENNIATDDFVSCLEESASIEEIYENNEIFYKLK
jgi:hypothetical protein